MSKDAPESKVSNIRIAFNLTMVDKDFLEDNKKVNIPIEPTSYTVVSSILDKLSKVDKNKIIDYIK